MGNADGKTSESTAVVESSRGPRDGKVAGAKIQKDPGSDIGNGVGISATGIKCGVILTLAAM
jgi:hypothetical protein